MKRIIRIIALSLALLLIAADQTRRMPAAICSLL